MPQIQVLPAHLADLIAAGEVVERPASAMKELLENAIDAGAKKIIASITGGGIESITVTDDGCGMSPDDAMTSFLRHATSKIRTEYDLEAIGTLGFRGEALAAISAVSHIELVTRRREDEFGFRALLEGGEVVSAGEAGAPIGTTFTVRSLFYNIPARRKFLKKDTYEAAACLQAAQRCALSHPEVSLRFLRDGKEELHSPGDGALQSAVYAVLGREVALGLMPVPTAKGEDIAVSGFVSKPVCCRGNRSHQYLFLNGRYIKSRALTAAVEQAYANQKMVGKFPAFVLHLTTKLSAVDCNVHPTKVEVKFAEERAVFSAVYHAVESVLARPVAPAAPKPAPFDALTPNQLGFRTMTAQAFSSASPSFSSRGAVSIARDPSTATAFAPPRATPSVERAVPAATLPVTPIEGKPSPTTTDARGTPTPAEAPSSEPDKPDTPATPTPAPPLERDYILRGEAFRTYMILEQGDNLIFIDKHAAHERMNFDRMKAEGYRPMVQQLLAPVTLRPAPEQRAALLEQLPLLEEFGFTCEDFGGGMLRVTAAPHDIDPGDLGDTLAELADTLLQGGTADPLAARDEMLHTMACKAAIKGGWHSSAAELLAVADRVMSGEIRYCPHGRPVSITMTKQDFEKQFKR